MSQRQFLLYTAIMFISCKFVLTIQDIDQLLLNEYLGRGDNNYFILNTTQNKINNDYKEDNYQTGFLTRAFTLLTLLIIF